MRLHPAPEATPSATRRTDVTPFRRHARAAVIHSRTLEVYLKSRRGLSSEEIDKKRKSPALRRALGVDKPFARSGAHSFARQAALSLLAGNRQKS